MRKSTFMYEICDLPLVIHNGVCAAYINGKAQIEYNRDGSWGTGQILVEGEAFTNANGKREWPYVPAPTALTAIIVGRLETLFEGSVQCAVNEMIEHDRECAADDDADMRRDHLVEH